MFDRVLKRPLILHEDGPYSEFFWSVFSRIQIEYGDLPCNLRIQSECGKIRSRKTPNKNTFYIVWLPYGGNIDLKSVKDIVIPASSVAMTFVWTIKALFCAITSPFVKDTMTIIALKFRTSCSLCWLCGCRRTCCCWGWNSGCGCREIRATVHFKPSTWSPMILINYNSHKSCLYGIL